MHKLNLISALNTLIQGAGSLIVKMGTIILNEDLHKRGFVWGKDLYNSILDSFSG